MGLLFAKPVCVDRRNYVSLVSTVLANTMSACPTQILTNIYCLYINFVCMTQYTLYIRSDGKTLIFRILCGGPNPTFSG